MWKVKGWDKFVESYTRLLASENYGLENKTAELLAYGPKV